MRRTGIKPYRQKPRYVGPRALVLSVLMVSMLLVACSGTRKSARSPEARLMQAYEQWRGTPYVLGGTTRSGVDCSAFVQIVMRQQLGVDLPRTTREQMNAGSRVRRARLKTGDLVFFQTGRNTYHVGIMLDSHRFLHASTSRGPMISSLTENYWNRRYLRSRRVM
jgi:cell wall-associated NlpC family hydrolase